MSCGASQCTMSAIPGPIYGLEVPPGEMIIRSQLEFPAAFRITMAALDPTQEPQADDEGNLPAVPRSTLRLVRRVLPTEEDEDDEEVDPEYFKVMLGGSDDEDDEANGGPSDPAKAKQHKQAAAIAKLLEAAKEQESEDEEMEDAEAKPKGKKNKSKSKSKPQPKGKGKAVVQEEEEDDEDDLSEEGDLDHFVLCTLDPEKHYQQPLDITVNQGEKVFFAVSGTHTVYLTGNYLMDDREEDEEDEEEEGDEDYDAEDLDFVVGDEGSDEESDELDDIDNPRVTEIDSDEEEAPKLVPTKKGKNKRSAEELAGGLDELMAKAAVDAKAAKASKKQEKQQQKKLKNNKGEAVAAEGKQEEAKQEAKQDGKKDNKKKDNKKDAKKTVQFAKNLEQGPTGSTTEKAKQAAPKPAITKVQGVTVDDRRVGRGRTAKSGDTVGVRYIGKLMNGQQFDANKKGKPFSFKLGKGQVIRGWDIGITGMAIGGERRLTIPHHLAYGSKSLPGIPSNSTLQFDVKLLEIK